MIYGNKINQQFILNCIVVFLMCLVSKTCLSCHQTPATAPSNLGGLVVNTLTFGLIQAVRKKTAGSHVALHGNIYAPVWVMDLVEVSKDAASLVVCTQKKILGWGYRFLSVTS